MNNSITNENNKQEKDIQNPELQTIPNTPLHTIPIPNTVVIYVGKNGHRVHMMAGVNRGTGERSYGIMIEYPDGNYTSMKFIPRRKILRSSNWADTFLDYDAGFTIEDIAEIMEEVRSTSEKLPSVVISEELTMSEVYNNLYCYCKASSGGGNDLYDEHLLSAGWKHYLLATTRKSCQVGSTKSIAEEWVWLNYEPPEHAKYYINISSVNW